jgi:hypothetical protein
MNLDKIVFDLKLLKRRLAEPVLLGDERMEDFDDYASPWRIAFCRATRSQLF